MKIKKFSIYFILIVALLTLTGCASRSQPNISILKHSGTKGYYNDLNSLVSLENEIVILVPKTNDKYKKFRNEIQKTYMGINVSSKKLEKCSKFHRDMMSLPWIHIGPINPDWLVDPLPLFKKYSNCLGIPMDIKIFEIPDIRLLFSSIFFGRKPVREDLVGTIIFSVYTKNIFYTKIIQTQPSVWLDGKLWANYLEYVIGVDESKKFPTIFSGYNYRAAYYEDDKSWTYNILDTYNKSLLEIYINKLYKYKIPFKLLNPEYKMAIINEKIKLIDMLFGLTPIDSEYSKYNLFTEYNPEKTQLQIKRTQN